MILGIISALIGLSFLILTLNSMMDTIGGDIAGWKFADLLVLLGVAQLVTAIMDFWLYPNMTPVSNYVREGEMDGILMKPIHPLFFVSIRRISSLGDLINIFIAVSLILYGMWLAHALQWENICLFILLIVNAIAIIFALWASLVTLAFRVTKAEDFAGFFYFIEDIGAFPISAMPAAARFFFSFIVPIAFVTNIPAEAALGILTWPYLLGAFAISLGSVSACLYLWRAALRVYTSASS